MMRYEGWWSYLYNPRKFDVNWRQNVGPSREVFHYPIFRTGMGSHVEAKMAIRQ